jgi:hypothetical protein
MTGPKKRPPPPRRRLEATVADPVKTKTLADRVKREVAFEQASEVDLATTDDQQAAVVVVLGPDGMPRIAGDVEAPPVAVRVAPLETNAKRRG